MSRTVMERKEGLLDIPKIDPVPVHQNIKNTGFDIFDDGHLTILDLFDEEEYFYESKEKQKVKKM